jgi:hypothetical protein
LRESTDFPAAFVRLTRILTRRKLASLEKISDDTVLLRAVQILTEQGYRSKAYQSLLRLELFRRFIFNACGKERKANFINQTESLTVEPLAILYDPATFLDEDSSHSIEMESHMLPACHKLLGHYRSWWLEGEGLRKNDLDQRMEETGVLDPIEDITNTEHDRFSLLLRSLYFSLLIIERNSAGSKMLLKIAQKCPAGVPWFSGDDLWLQRIAALKLYDLIGFERFLKFLPVLRATHFYYIDLMRKFTHEEKERILQKFILHPESRRNDDYVRIEEWLKTKIR